MTKCPECGRERALDLSKMTFEDQHCAACYDRKGFGTAQAFSEAHGGKSLTHTTETPATGTE